VNDTQCPRSVGPSVSVIPSEGPWLPPPLLTKQAIPYPTSFRAKCRDGAQTPSRSELTCSLTPAAWSREISGLLYAVSDFSAPCDEINAA
jgi:hypothetical protein